MTHVVALVMKTVLLALVCLASLAEAQDYPAKSVRLIAAAAPGGNPDVLGRMLAAKLAESFGRPFVVENIPGAGGVVAAELVARSAPDGHVLMMGDSGAMAINIALNPKVPYHPLKDFALITALAAVPTVLVANPSVPAASLHDFVTLVKGQSGKFSYGSAGNGSVHHLTMAVFASRAGLDMLHVPYKGGSALVAAVLAGEVQSGWSGIPNVLAHIRAGKLKVYAISTAQRSSTLPDVPTAAELGFPGFDIATVIGLQAPAGTPREVVARLQAAVAKALRERDVAERMANLAMELRENGTENYVRFVKEDLERYSAAVKTAGVKHD
ncbi:MAG TPA: tripartite tricarboxylate transporter substrate binding protein [Burkholderiales bacterium]|nr:tripartite tricarboxylate transporter substrate binding protein [Burkholderiales bacterium]